MKITLIAPKNPIANPTAWKADIDAQLDAHVVAELKMPLFSLIPIDIIQLHDARVDLYKYIIAQTSIGQLSTFRTTIEELITGGENSDVKTLVCPFPISINQYYGAPLE